MVLPTYSPKESEIERSWYVVDAQGLTLGRLASEIAKILRGKHRPIFAPHMDTGEFVIVTNASLIAVSAGKLDKKIYYRHSGYPGGLRQTALKDELSSRPEEVVRRAVKGMLPKGPLGRKMLGKLKVYSGPTHPHGAQKPVSLILNPSSGFLEKETSSVA